MNVEEAIVYLINFFIVNAVARVVENRGSGTNRGSSFLPQEPCVSVLVVDDVANYQGKLVMASICLFSSNTFIFRHWKISSEV